ncbi:thermonuclease family protein [Natrinema gelatinilyticum]|uniref:thermonuclease family protein n=1 Tax=Natrinema gelatinilyticum TaxID=2961571 RepID=UPI0020C2D253|nr:hypothetical protein [Natrinema gelatinilyticum]
MPETSYFGTTMTVEVLAVVDGDTVKVDLEDEPENLRILALDTEESRPVPGKPYTPWGVAAKEEATSFLPEGSTITIEFRATDRSIPACGGTGTTTTGRSSTSTRTAKTSRSG